ncbi:hypothetical protein C5E43_21390 [Nocardia cyriacigeorgica]|nr:hypothetical protein C5B73_24560 [Nocardia cyriacigeorgica]PPJ05573.1 hypothetical protein C5E43_21390 [Nocardia cyriacigeorgica]
MTIAEAVAGVEVQGLGGSWLGRGRAVVVARADHRGSGVETVPQAVPAPLVSGRPHGAPGARANHA